MSRSTCGSAASVLVLSAVVTTAAASCGDPSGGGPRAASRPDAGSEPHPASARAAPPPAAPASAWASPPPAASASFPPPVTDAGVPDVVSSRCSPEAGPDEPDDDFVDSNCDGIDGDRDAAIFVATSGSDEAAGTPEAPVQTLARAVALAAGEGKSVYVCNGSYAENVVIAKTAVSLHGGYDCEHGWRRARDRATVAPPQGVPITIREVPTAIVIDHLAFRAADAKGPGESSIGAVVVDSVDVRFVRDEIWAGNGADGVDGAVIPVTPLGRAPDGKAGEDVRAATNCRATGAGSGALTEECNQVPKGGWGLGDVCPGRNGRSGGRGGDGGNWGKGIAAISGSPGVPSQNPGGDGGRGQTAAPGVGSFVRVAGASAAYVPGDGTRGSPGRIGSAGRGGDGGYSSSQRGDVAYAFTIGGGGGQGGLPGCGGKGGNAGTGGGASVGLLSLGGSLRVESTQIFTGRGGAGGGGSDGTPGQEGGRGGRGGLCRPELAGAASVCDGQPGQDGGNGGDGSAGGPGSGGPSIGIVHDRPLVTDALTVFLGRGGEGGLSSEGKASPGTSAEVFAVGEIADGGK